tara:strand:- start:64 stop:912 length:849 start_codon:yes stop_codon:yes gene_type:complete
MFVDRKMIQGFGTREITDQILRAFVKSANGIMHEKQKVVGQYEQTVWPTFEKMNTPVAVWGCLRGTEAVIDEAGQNEQDWYFFDHAYVMNESKHMPNMKLKDRVYRVTKNAQLINDIDELSYDDYNRIEKYKEHVQLEPWKKDGKYILVFEPSDFAKRWWEVPNWTEDTIQLLKRNTNLEIRIRKKNSLISFESEVKGAKAVVSLQSAAAIQAHIWGIPGYCAEMSAAYPVSHSMDMIEQGLDSIQYIPDHHRVRWLNSILANQYTMTEIADGTCYNRLKDR